MLIRWEDYRKTPVDLVRLISESGITLKQEKSRKPSNKANNYVNILSAFDIETTRLDLPIPKGEKQNSHAFMYIWQFQLGMDLTIIGRYWEEFLELIDALCETLYLVSEQENLDEIPHLVCWVHNLAFEWQFISYYYPFRNSEVFFREPRKPIYCTMHNCIEFRCSYMQTNMSLEALTKRYGVEQKLSGQKYNYDKIRFPWTELSDYEIAYCTRDVSSLVRVMQIRMTQDGDNYQTVPLTSTGYVRRDVKEALKPIYLQIRDILPKEEEYRLLRDAFRGGNTHCNKMYSEKTLTGDQAVFSYDMASCYPAMQLTKRYPVKPWHFLDRVSIERVTNFVELGYAVVGRYVFTNLRLKDKNEPIPYLSLSRTNSTGHLKVDNGRILYVDVCEAVLTEIDLDIVQDQYTFDQIAVTSAMVAQKGFLPDEYRDVIRRYYHNKTALKGLEGKTPEETKEILYLYQKAKELLNAIFGMSCQSALNSDVFYINGEYIVLDYETRKKKIPELIEKLKEKGIDDKELEKALDKAKDVNKTLKKARFPYSWGVYTTSYARQALQQGIDLAKRSSDGTLPGGKMVYCDTDSIKTIGPIDIEQINKDRRALAVRHKGVEKDRKGKPHYIGEFEFEGSYHSFRSCGAKRYAYIKEGCPRSDSCKTWPLCKMGITVSGVSKEVNEETGIPFAVEELKSLDRFKPGMIWSQAGSIMAVYNDNDDFYYTDPETGRSVHITKNVALVPSTYKMTYEKDYKALLQELQLYGEYKDERM